MCTSANDHPFSKMHLYSDVRAMEHGNRFFLYCNYLILLNVICYSPSLVGDIIFYSSPKPLRTLTGAGNRPESSAAMW